MREKATRTLEGLTSAAAEGDPEERLRRFIAAYWRHLRRPAFGAMYRLLLTELPQSPELARFYATEVSGKVIQLCSAIVREGVDRKRFRAVEPETASRMIVALLIQHAIWTSRPELFPHVAGADTDDILSQITDFALHALAPARGGGRRSAT
ncbi:MAG TPA: TetR-like C-terminal domain-containing protein [Longimicrobiales bacterium]|nr:TetR-like C-terminal domain-containing protein [Longimicrobiales bacterium]